MELQDFKYASSVIVSGDCWEWVVPEDYSYPYAYIKGVLAHRVTYAEFVGPIPEGLSIDHMCHNTRCVRPDHLWAVTHKQNMENRKGAHKNNRTGVRNVMLTREGSYQVRVSSNRKTYCFGTYPTLEEADAVAQEARQRLHTLSN